MQSVVDRPFPKRTYIFMPKAHELKSRIVLKSCQQLYGEVRIPHNPTYMKSRPTRQYYTVHKSRFYNNMGPQ